MKVHVVGDHLTFTCPGCKGPHSLSVAPGRWTWNHNTHVPTIHPSILVTDGHFVPGFNPAEHRCWCTYNAEHPDDPASFKCSRCHSFVKDGMIQFLADSTHELAGQTVMLPEWGSMA